ncbi:glycyl-tRNA synthetase [Roseimicrobium gellanilyticum]|uniref:glycine--tRNA ligase n=1 Tax=Roseimicrobium gellanilyticum TaxID=748857 RepID=A0A366HVF2_9BACT|nr:glycine--tRNA ligase [Roseimicrobium gellanilyticum]RBP47278.1 glycyl-tRNA synthetase [Roseimicrobium gellanilyticum]
MPEDKKDTASMEKLVSLCKRRGFIYQSSEIYGGIAGFWDYGPLGAELKRNLRDTWWRAMTREREDVVGLDATIIMHPNIWKASGHVDTFSDPMSDCLLTKKRFRSDHVDLQSGMVYRFTGATGAEDTKSDVPFAVLAPQGKPRESALKIAKLFYEQRGVKSPEPTGGETGEKVENTRAFNPENGAQLTEPRPFNLMFRTFVGPTATDADVAYLRPETAQAIFAQFKNVVDSSRVKVPFGICQIGKAFRNEVTPKNFTFRSREFEQMELEFFIKPDEAIEILTGAPAQAWSESADLSTPQPTWGWDLWHRYWVAQRTEYYNSIGLGTDVLDYYTQSADDLAHYARACTDILFKFPFGTDELEGVAARGEFDLSQHQKHSGKPQEYFDDELKAAAAKLTEEQKEAMIQKRIAAEQAKTKGTPLTEAEVRAWFDRLFKGFYVPHVIEPSAGLDRLALAVLASAFCEEEKADMNGKVEVRTLMRLHPRIAPIKVGVFPLLKNKPELVSKAREVYDLLKKHMNCFYDETAAIGRRYARQDEAGTPFGVTIDFETLGEKGEELKDTVTVRERDSNAQHRIKISELLGWLVERVQ